MSIDISRAREITEKVNYLTIATVDADGNPWNAPVFGYCDKDFNCLWGSYEGSQHSKNIALNGKAYIVIYDSTAPPGTGEGVYVRGKARKIEDENEAAELFELMKKRHDDHFWPLEAMTGEGPIRFYKLQPEQVWTNDGDKKDGVYIDTRSQIV